MILYKKGGDVVIMTNDKDRYTLRMPHKYTEAIRRDAATIGTSMAAVILRIFAKHYGFLDEDDTRKERTA